MLINHSNPYIHSTTILCDYTLQSADIMKSTKVQTLGNLTEMLHVLGEQTGMKLSCIKPRQVRGLSIEPGSSTGYIDACIYYSKRLISNKTA